MTAASRPKNGNNQNLNKVVHEYQFKKLHFKRCHLAVCVYYAKETKIVYISAAKVLIIPRPTKRKPLKRVKNKADIKNFPYLCTEFFHR